MSDGPEVAVVIPTRNRADRLEAALESLRAQTLDRDRFEVIVVDDGSTDDTAARLERFSRADGPRITALRNDPPLGSGAARNRGWRSTTAPVIAFMDDDCEAEPGWLEAGLAACRPGGSTIVQGSTLPIEREAHRLGPFSYSVEVRSLDIGFQTCNMLYPRAVLEQIDGFDAEAFPAPQGEDTDLAYRAQAQGATLAFAPEVEMRHAVVELGPAGFLRRAASWGNCMELCVRHPAFKRSRLVYRIFWNPSHYELARLALAVALPRGKLWWPLKLWLARPYLTWRLNHPRTGRYAPWLLPWFAVVDTVEALSVLRGSLRHGTLVL